MIRKFIDPYLDQNGVLKNKLGITDDADLSQKEADISAIRMNELQASPVSEKFDFDHLKKIHEHLFKDVYEWAGEYRTIDIQKENSQFCNRNHIESFANHIFKEIQKNHKVMLMVPGAFKEDLPEKLAHYFGEINALHPFREGNGRTQKIFIDQLAKVHGLEIEWQKMGGNQLIEASKESMIKEPKLLAKLIRENSKGVEDSLIHSRSQKI